MIKNTLEKVYDKRYIIALCIFAVFVLLKLNFSSISSWSKIVGSSSTNIIGINRGIRSDEWMVQTPFFLSQTFNNFKIINENIGYSGQNMLMVYAAPVLDITIIGKIFNIGFILLGRDYGLSWYFVLKMLMCILVSIEIASIILKKNKVMSIILGLWLAFTPSVMWWFSSSGDVTIYAFAIIAAFYYYTDNLEMKIYKKVLIGLLMISLIVGFVLCFYPALQVPVFYIMLAFIIPKFILNFKKYKKVDWIIIATAVLIALGILGYYLATSLDAIKLIMDTVYPGKRFETGGTLGITPIINYFCNFFTPFTGQNLPTGYNQCEISASIYPFIALIVSLVILVIQKYKKKIDIKGIFKDELKFVIFLLVLVFIFQFVFCFIGIPSFLAKISFMYMSTTNRTLISFGIIGIILCMYVFNQISTKEILINKKVALIVSIVTVVISFVLIKVFKYDVYLNLWKIIVLLPVLFVLCYSFLIGSKKVFLPLIFVITLLTGMSINPINYSTDAIYNSKVAKEIMNIEENDKDAMWISNESKLSQYLVALGVHTLNGVNYYPQFEWLNKIDEDGKYSDIYNRYAHISIELSNENKFEMVQNDWYMVYITKEKLSELGISYFFSNKKYDDEITNEFNMTEIYDDINNNLYIYKVE